MADFVAVIRRAVDGLSDNTPEMRAKVYEKARGAVVRQLESMKPRPPEEMLKRQLDKLEAAIVEVESEHALALPELEAAMQFDDEPALAAAAETQPADDDPRPPVSEPAPPVAPPVEEPAPESPVYDEPPAPEPVPEPQTPPEPPRGFGSQRGVWQDDDDYVSYVSEPAPPPAPKPDPALVVPQDPYAAERAAVRAQWASTPEPEPVAPKPVAGEPEPPVLETVAYEGPAHPYGEVPEAGPSVAPVTSWDPPEDPFADEPEQPDDQFAAYDGALSAAPVEAEEHSALAPALTPEDGYLDTEAHRDYADLGSSPRSVDLSAPPYEPARTEAQDPWEIPEDSALPDLAPAPDAPVTPAFAAATPAFGSPSYSRPAQPVAPPALSPPTSASWDESPFDDVPLPSSPALAAAPASRMPGKTDDRDLFQQDWGELESFDTQAPATAEPAGLERVEVSEIERPKRVIRFEPKRRVDFTSLGLGLLGLLIVGGAAFGAWTYRETLSELVGGVVGTPPTETAKPATTTTPPAATTTPAASGDESKATPDETPAEPLATETAAVEPNQPVIDDNTVGDKFNQRLMKDGSEVDAGDGAPGTAEEGKSVAAQNVAAPDLPPPASGATTTPATPGAAANTAGATQKMYVYEERIGQTVPTAIEGAVAWSLKNEAGADGKPEPIVEGQITVPERGMTAKFTLRRNSDPSLPASHLIEIVFSLPPDFEGGAIDSVQRVAMKQTEQDRGNSLVAVPAKITDDFHMIALNNYPDAMATNLDLLQSRNWIDIPVTYRNGRRALLTMEKGPTGTEAFNAAIREWKRLGTGSTPAN